MKRKSALGIVLLGSIGILATLANNIIESPSNPLASGLAIFKYFTILSNLFVVLFFLMYFLLRLDKEKSFNHWLGAVTLYITVTCLVFIIFLQKGYSPHGLGLLSNILNHYIVPVLTISFLIFYRKDYFFKYQDIFKWLLFPILYILFVLIQGSFTNDYIYPFLNLNQLGIGLFLVNVFILFLLFIILSVLNVFLTRQKK